MVDKIHVSKRLLFWQRLRRNTQLSRSTDHDPRVGLRNCHDQRRSPGQNRIHATEASEARSHCTADYKQRFEKQIDIVLLLTSVACKHFHIMVIGFVLLCGTFSKQESNTPTCLCQCLTALRQNTFASLPFAAIDRS